MSRILYKYLDINGAKCMIGNQNLPLKGDCYDCIYWGVKIDPKEKEKIINYVLKKLNPDTKLYQMQVDENAFRLKAELITD